MFADIASEMNELRKSFDRFFGQYSDSQQYPRTTTEGTEWTFAPPIETGWTDDHLNLRFVLPAVSREDVDVAVQGNQLVVRGERKAPVNFGKEGQTWQRMTYGRFQRALDLPHGLDLEKLQAHLHEGVLDIQIPVAAEVKPKKISISVDGGSAKIAA